MLEHEERIATTLRTISDDVRTRPTLVADVRRGATRRRTRRRVLGGAAIAAVAAVVAGSAVAIGAGGPRSGPGPAGDVATSPSPAAYHPAACTIQKLPVPAGQPRSLVTGGDPGGRFLVGRGYTTTGYTDRHPLLIWDGDRVTTVDMPGNDESFADINGTGVAVGNSIDDGGHTSAFVYRDGKLDPLQGPSAYLTARAVGEDGTIVGVAGNYADEPMRPLVWHDPTKPAQPLPLPDGFTTGTADDVDTDGTIVGMVIKPGPGDDGQGYVWKPDGTVRLLPMPEIDGRPASALRPKVIHHGVVLADAIVRDARTMKTFPVLLDLRTGTYTRLTQGYGGAGNTMGWLLQTANPLSVAAPTGRAVLPPLATTGDRMIDRAVFISADGQVIGGQSADADGQMQAVRWRCTRST